MHMKEEIEIEFERLIKKKVPDLVEGMIENSTI
jgi:hypothetical protein